LFLAELILQEWGGQEGAVFGAFFALRRNWLAELNGWKWRFFHGFFTGGEAGKQAAAPFILI
jgi:hypothetical protein